MVCAQLMRISLLLFLWARLYMSHRWQARWLTTWAWNSQRPGVQAPPSPGLEALGGFLTASVSWWLQAGGGGGQFALCILLVL